MYWYSFKYNNYINKKFFFLILLFLYRQLVILNKNTIYTMYVQTKITDGNVNLYILVILRHYN